MKLLPSFRKTRNPVTETKSSYPLDLLSFLTGQGWGRVAAYQALRYYEQVAPVATAIDLVTDEIKALDLSIKDENQGDYNEQHPFTMKLEQPNPHQSGAAFMKELSAVFLATGEAFILALGNRSRAPLELYVVRPNEVDDTLSADGLVDAYRVTKRGVSTTFRRSEERGMVRYLNGNDRELWPITEFNPCSSSYHRGASRLNSIYYEIEQHLMSSKHNLALLQNGGRVTGALLINDVLNDDEFTALQEQVQRFYGGSDNAGRIFIANGGVNYKEMGNTNRDMDFMSLKSDITVAIFNRLKIPLPLISRDTMTMANMAAAKLNLYDNAVLPLAWELLDALDTMLRDRFALKDTERLAIDPESIEALQPRSLENLKARKELGIYSINELRTKDGAEQVKGGDAILQPATMVPVAQDVTTSDNRTEPSDMDKSARSHFLAVMAETKSQHGLTDAEVKAIADAEFGVGD